MAGVAMNIDAKSVDRKHEPSRGPRMGLPTAAFLLLAITHVWPWFAIDFISERDIWLGVALGQLFFWPLFLGVVGARLRWPVFALLVGLLVGMAMAWLSRWQLAYIAEGYRPNRELFDVYSLLLFAGPVLLFWMIIARRRLWLLAEDFRWAAARQVSWTLAKPTLIVGGIVAAVYYVSWVLLSPMAFVGRDGLLMAVATIASVAGLAGLGAFWGGLMAIARIRPPLRWRRIAVVATACAVGLGFAWWTYAWPQVQHHRAHRSLVDAKEGVSTFGGFYDNSRLPPWRKWFDQYAPYVDGILFDGETMSVDSPAGCGDLRDERRVIELWNPDEGDRMIEHIAKSKGVWSLSIGHPYLRFDVRDGKFGDSGLGHVAKMNDVLFLDLYSTSVTGRGIEHLQALPTLRTLRISGNPLNESDLTAVAKLSSLRTLVLAHAGITDDGVKQLATMHDITSIGLYSNAISDAGVAHLAGLKQLVHVGLSGNKIDDGAVRYLANLTSLESLNLQRTRITGEGLRWLARLPKLESIELEGSPVDDVGAMALASLPIRVKINFGEIRKVTPEGILALHRERVRLQRLRLKSDAEHVTDEMANVERDEELLPDEDFEEFASAEESDAEREYYGEENHAAIEFYLDTEILKEYGLPETHIEGYRRHVFGEPPEEDVNIEDVLTEIEGDKIKNGETENGATKESPAIITEPNAGDE
jgi:hypothetical protein